MATDPVQTEVAAAILRVTATHDFALAGAYGLNVRGVVDRPTEDVDLFTTRARGPADVLPAVTAALTDAGYTVQVTRPPTADGDFARLTATRGADAVTVDLARDWRAQPPTTVAEIGPVLTTEDLLASKAAALASRSATRDYLDNAAALTTHTRKQLMAAAFAHDPGLRVQDFTDAATRLDRLPDEQFTSYGLDTAAITALRSAYATWPRDPAHDPAGHAAHTATHPTASPAELGLKRIPPSPAPPQHPPSSPTPTRAPKDGTPRSPGRGVRGASHLTATPPLGCAHRHRPVAPQVRTAVASAEFTRTRGAPGSPGSGTAWTLTSAMTSGRNTRQWLDPPNWK